MACNACSMVKEVTVVSHLGRGRVSRRQYFPARWVRVFAQQEERGPARSLDVSTPPYPGNTARNVVEQVPSSRWRGTAPCTGPRADLFPPIRSGAYPPRPTTHGHLGVEIGLSEPYNFQGGKNNWVFALSPLTDNQNRRHRIVVGRMPEVGDDVFLDFDLGDNCFRCFVGFRVTD